MKNADDMLKQALTPKNEPDYWLNQDILKHLKEDAPMKKMNRKKFATVAISGALALGIGSISVYAAWKYLNPGEVVSEIGEDRLADAFSEENAVYINETQSYGGYDVTLLGITSGENLTKYKYLTDDFQVAGLNEESAELMEEALQDGLESHDDRTYVMFAIEGEGLSSGSYNYNPPFDSFPIVAGYDPEVCQSMFGHGSGMRQIKKDGVLYLMYECDNLEKFADHDIYMCVSDDMPAFSEYSYLYDEASGSLTRNEEYEGLNALFSLPLDPLKADPAAAEAELKAYQDRQKTRKTAESEQKSPLPGSIQEAFDFVSQITPENIEEHAVLLDGENSERTFVPDNQGRVLIEYSDDSGITRWKVAVEELFADGKTEFVSSDYGVTNQNLDTLLVHYYKLNEDQTVTLKLYTPNLPE